VELDTTVVSWVNNASLGSIMSNNNNNNPLLVTIMGTVQKRKRKSNNSCNDNDDDAFYYYLNARIVRSMAPTANTSLYHQVLLQRRLFLSKMNTNAQDSNIVQVSSRSSSNSIVSSFMVVAAARDQKE
jgi:hypothetical protein